MADIDLDAIESEVAKGKRPKTVAFGGKTFKLPRTLPLEYGASLARGDIEGALVSLFGPRAAAANGEVPPPTQLDEFFELGPTLDGFPEFAEKITKLYTGREPGESPASRSSSKSTSKRSRPTSSASTT